MTKKKDIKRPGSYRLNEFSIDHLRCLHSRFTKLIEIMRPAFVAAETQIAHEEDCKNNAKNEERYRSPAELLIWLDERLKNLDKLCRKKSLANTNLEGDDLDNIRQIRAFSIRFSSVGKNACGGKSYFQTHQNEIFSLLSHKYHPYRQDGGILNLTRLMLQEEEPDSRADLGKIRDTLKVGKTIKDVWETSRLLKDTKVLKYSSTPTPSPNTGPAGSIPAQFFQQYLKFSS